MTLLRSPLRSPIGPAVRSPLTQQRGGGGGGVPVEGSAPANTSLPEISGDYATQPTISVSNGSWTNDPIEFEYQWLRDGVAIEFATNSTYVLVAADIDADIAATVTAINEHGQTDATSAAIGPVNGVAPTAGTITISGGSTPPLVGETLNANPGTWTGVPAPGFTYQWRGGAGGTTDISGATNSTYQLQAGDEDDLITVIVTGTNTEGSDSGTSASVGPVDASGDVTAPILSNLVATTVDDTTAALSVDTDEGNGTIYFVVVPTAATAPNAAQVVAGTDGSGTPATWDDSVAVSTIDTYNEGPTGLTAGTTYDAYAVHVDAVGNISNVVTDEFTTAGDIIAPTLSSMLATPIDVSSSLSVSTDEGNGTLYWLVALATATAPSAAQVEAGTDGDSVAGVYTASEAVGSTGTKTETATGLTASTNYVAYAMHKDASGNRSTVASDAFTTTATETVIYQHYHNGSTASLVLVRSVMTANQTDAFGGNNAVLWQNDGMSAGAATVILTTPANGATYASGANKIRCRFLVVAAPGKVWLRVNPSSTSSSPLAHIDITDDSTPSASRVGNTAAGWTSVTVVKAGDGWIDFEGTLAQPGPDYIGQFAMNMAAVNNSSGVTNTSAGAYGIKVHNLRVVI